MTQAQATIQPALLTVSEAMEYTGLGRDAVYAMVRSNTWPAFKVGVRDWRIVRESIDRWIAQMAAEAAQEHAAAGGQR